MLSVKRPAIGYAIALIVSVSFLLAYIIAARAETSARILNLDQKAYKITVEEGNAKRELSLGPKQELANICASECLLVIDGDPEPYQIAAYDRIMIEEGQLFYRSEEDAAAGADQKEETEDDPEPTPAPAPDEGGTR